MNGISELAREYQGDCRQSKSSQSIGGCETIGGSKRLTSHTTDGARLHPKGSRTKLQSGTCSHVDQRVSHWGALDINQSMIRSLVVLVFLFLSICTVSATTTTTTNTSQLLELCRTDAICASKFYLSSTPSSYNEKAFLHLFEMFTRDANITLLDAPSSGSLQVDSWWWLQLLRRADFCGAGQFYLYGVGCRCRKPGSCDAPDPSKFVWEYWTFIAIAIGILIIIVWKAQAIVSLQVKLDKEIQLLRRASLSPSGAPLPQSMVVRTDVKL